MSVPNQTPYNIYTANGLTTVFPFEFYLLNAGICECFSTAQRLHPAIRSQALVTLMAVKFHS